MHTIATSARSARSARSAAGVLAALAVAAALAGCTIVERDRHDGRGRHHHGADDGRGHGPDGRGMDGRGKGPDGKGPDGRGQGPDGRGPGGRGQGPDGKGMDGRDQRGAGGARPLDMRAVCAAYGQGGGKQSAKDRAMLERDLKNMSPEMRERHMEIVRRNCAPGSKQ